MQNNDLHGGEGGIRTPEVAPTGPSQPSTGAEPTGPEGAGKGQFRSEFRSKCQRLATAPTGVRP